MKTLRLSAYVRSNGTIEVVDPIPEEFRSADVDLVIVKDGNDSEGDRLWQRAALESFFADDDEADAIYDSL